MRHRQRAFNGRWGLAPTTDCPCVIIRFDANGDLSLRTEVVQTVAGQTLGPIVLVP